jgi:transposase
MVSQNGSIEGRSVENASDGSGRPDPEVPERLERARRRQFTVGYKLRILSEADAARTTGEIGALLRREGLYSSHLAAWRRQREEGILHALSPRRRGRPTSSPEQRELARLRQENERLSQRLVAAEAVIEVQKKLRCCSDWSSRAVRTTSAPDGERDRTGARRRGGQGLRGGRRGPCQLAAS